MTSNWLPIETAPMWKGILVHYNDGSIELIEADDNAYAWTPYDGKNENAKGVAVPTHWLPLPPPPTQHEKEQTEAYHDWTQRAVTVAMLMEAIAMGCGTGDENTRVALALAGIERAAKTQMSALGSPDVLRG